MNIDPALDEHGIPQEARPTRKWPAYLLTGICLASGIAQMYWSVAIASTHLADGHHRWAHEHYAPESPSFVAVFLSGGVLFWLTKEQDKYSKTEKRLLYTALFLAVALGVIGWLILSEMEPYRAGGG